MRTLKQLRESSGLTLEQAAKLVREADPGAPKTAVGFWHIENKGTDRILLIRAISKAYGVRESEVEAAALLAFASRQNNFTQDAKIV